MNHTTRLTALALSLGLAGSALAQAPAGGDVAHPSTLPEFSSIDQNKDGKLSMAEAQTNTALQSAFATLDADRDAYLSQTEYAKWKPGKVEGAKPRSEEPVSEEPREDPLP